VAPTQATERDETGEFREKCAASDSETSEVLIGGRSSVSKILNDDDSDLIAENSEDAAEDDDTAPTIQRADPFTILNPFKRQLNDRSKLATKVHINTLDKTSKRPKSGFLQMSSDEESLVHVSHDSSMANSQVASVNSDERSPTKTQDSGDNESIPDEPTVPSGTLKDPASMTDAEKAAFFGDDEDL
jgi:hypothetical protein